MLYALVRSENAFCIISKCAHDDCRSKGSGWVSDLNVPLSAIKTNNYK